MKPKVMKEYWLESLNGQGCFQETKEEFYKAINAGFRGFIKYESGKIYWISNRK
jgi:hypothetical protein